VKVLIPDSLPLSLDSSHNEIEFIPYSVSSTDFTGVQDSEFLVLWMNTDENLRAAVEQLTNLKLVQTLAAGPDHVLSAGFPMSVAIASGRSLHDKTVTEHALALTLSAIRNLDSLREAQNRSFWDQEFIAAQAAPTTQSLYTLNGAEVLIIGFGSIAAQFAPVLTSLGAHVRGVARKGGERAGYEVTPISKISSLLSQADVVISLLHYAAESEKYFNDAFFNKMKVSSIFINVGRGKTVDELALVRALSEKKIRKASIDVTFAEPLPADSPLWHCPNLTITPHVSGGRPLDSEKLILANSENLLHSREITNLVVRI
jgi:phosphoglycerate dehydrogenase-like enzyme